MTTSFLPKTLLTLLLLSGNFQIVAANRVVAFKFVEGSGTCKAGEAFNITLGEFHVDCGNANHGCTPGHSVLIYGDFQAMDTFYSVADVDIKACEFGSTFCTNNFIMTDMNLCADLELWDNEGYQKCNEIGDYTFEASYFLPNHTWWEDFAFEGLTFQIYITFDQDLVCHGQFITHVYYGNEGWMLLAVSSMALVFGAYYYVQKKRQGNVAKINLTVEETKAAEGAAEGTEEGKGGDSSEKIKRAFADDESVTSTAYLKMLDFSPEGLSHRDQMEQVRQAHFERLRKTRDSRRSKRKGEALLP